MARFLRLLAILSAFAWVATPSLAAADDIAAASRSVVRVVTIAIVDQEVVGFGHGSGFAVGPNRIVTNAHVVELAQKYPDNVVIGVVPSEGSKSYQGRVVAIDAKRDLALIEFTGGALPIATLYTGTPDDSMGLVSLGYPGNVDLATAQSAADYIKPLSPVRSDGALSAMRNIDGLSVLRAVRGQVVLANRYTLPVNFRAQGNGVWLRGGAISRMAVPVDIPIPQ